MTILNILDANTGHFVEVNLASPSGIVYISDSDTGEMVEIDLASPSQTLKVTDADTGDQLEVDLTAPTGRLFIVSADTGDQQLVDLENPTGEVYVPDFNTGKLVLVDLTQNLVLPTVNSEFIIVPVATTPPPEPPAEPPLFVSAEVGNVNAQTVVVTFDHAVKAGENDFLAGVIIKINGTITNLISGTQGVDHTKVLYAITNAVVYGDTVTWEYVPGIIVNEDTNDPLEAVTVQAVINNVAYVDPLIVLDNFTGGNIPIAEHLPDTDTLNKGAWLGGNIYTGAQTGVIELEVNNVYIASIGDCIYRDIGTSNFDVTAEWMTTVGENNYCIMVFRENTMSGNHYLANFRAGANKDTKLIKVADYVETALNSVSYPDFTPGNTYTLRLTAIGNVFTFYIDGVQVWQVTDSTYPSGTSLGLGRAYGSIATRYNSVRIESA